MNSTGWLKAGKKFSAFFLHLKPKYVSLNKVKLIIFPRHSEFRQSVGTKNLPDDIASDIIA